MISRRNALIGIGTVAAGAGVIAGTGAFTSVSADRSVSVSTTGDDSALVGLVPGNENPEYADASGDTLELNLDGLNLNATTELDDVFRVVNNSTQEVEIDLGIVESSLPANLDAPQGINGLNGYAQVQEGDPSSGSNYAYIAFDLEHDGDSNATLASLDPGEEVSVKLHLRIEIRP